MTSDKIENKLKQVLSIEKGSWLEDAQFRADNKKWLKRSQAIAITVIRTIKAGGMNQKDLAARMGLSAQQINKWLKGKENFTLETIARLEDALNIELMNVVGDDANKLKKKPAVVKKDSLPYNSSSDETGFGERIIIVQEPVLPLKRSRKKYSSAPPK